MGGTSVTVVGAGSWGTALATSVLSKNFEQVTLWCRREELAREINQTKENSKYLPGVAIPENVLATSSLAEAVADKELLVWSVPSAHLRGILQVAAPLIRQPVDCVNTAKGLEQSTLQRLTEVISAELQSAAASVSVLSGPNHAEEVGLGMPAASVISNPDADVAMRLQDAFFTPSFRVYTSLDVIGVELGGALKNVIALAAGVSDGMGYGDNTKAMLMTRGLVEMVRLGQKMGADRRTFSGLAGIGDLIATCTSKHSRNWNAGYKIGQGWTLEQVTGGTHMVIEGAFATKAAYKLSQQLGVDMPLAQSLYQVLFEGAEPLDTLHEAMNRVRKHEYEDVAFPQ